MPLSSAEPLLVLLIDDHEDTRDMYCEYLRTVDGIGVVEGVTPETAFARSLQTLPSVIVTDYKMAGVDGFELCNRLRAHPATSHIPLVMLTGHGAADDLQKFLSVCAAVLLKPVDPETLLAELRRAVALGQRFTAVQDD
jgi:CheY-like chemotaxis protein